MGIGGGFCCVVLTGVVEGVCCKVYKRVIWKEGCTGRGFKGGRCKFLNMNCERS